MIYIENNLERQDLFIPRNDGSGCYVSPYDKGYQDGYKDGLDDCGAGCTLQEKDVTITAATQTVRPDSGYVGMEAVNINASQFVLEKYTEGYHEGEEDGAEEQKSKLASTAFTENGVYRREDGWNEVEVVVTPTPCPELGPDVVSLNGAWDGDETYYPSGIGKDGFSQFRVYDNGYGNKKYNDGVNAQKALLSSTTFTQNGVYDRADGWNEVVVDVYTGTSCNLESKTETITAETQTILPSSGYDGMSRVTVEAGTLAQNKYDEGFNDGKTAILSGMTDTLITQNGIYSNPSGWSGVTVSVPQTGSSCNLQQKHIDIQSGWTGSTIVPDSGYDGMSVVTISDAGYGNEKFDEGFDRGYNQGYRDGEASCTPCPEIESGVSYGLESGFTGFTITPSSGYDGMDSVEIYDDGYGQEKYDEGHSDGYDEGYQDGLNDCPACPQPSLEAVSYALPSGFTGTTITPSSGYDGMSSVTITDGGYGQEKYNEGYQDGLGDCPAPTLEQKSVTLTATTETVTPSQGFDGMDEVSIDASGLCQNYYNSGVTVGENNIISGMSSTAFTQNATYTNSSGWSAVTVNVPQTGSPCNLQNRNVVMTATTQVVGPTAGYDGMSAVTIDGSNLYNMGLQSVVSSFFTANTTGYLIAYYYTETSRECLITGYYTDGDTNIDGTDCFSSMSVNGGEWETPSLYKTLPAGWTQIRFQLRYNSLNAAFSHHYTPCIYCYMDALKAVSLPKSLLANANYHSFTDNTGIRILSTKEAVIGGDIVSGATNLNIMFSHYKGTNIQYTNFVSSGVLFIPQGESSHYSGKLSGWKHIELF